MSYELTVYTPEPCDEALLATTFAASFPEHAIEVVAWRRDGGQARVALRSSGKRSRGRASSDTVAVLDVASRHLPAPPPLEVPTSSRKKLAGLRMAYVLRAQSTGEIAAAWTLAATLALARDGFVDDPQDRLTSTASHARTRAARIVRGALTERPAQGPDVDDDRPLPQHLAEERRSMFAASLRRHADAGTFEPFIGGAPLDAELLRVGLTFSSDAGRADVSLALARHVPAEVLAAHALDASRAPGLRSRLYLEHLIQAGALDGLSPDALREVFLALSAQREPELVALLRARSSGPA